MTKIFSLALFTVFLISGCASTQTKQIPLRDDIILEANDAALCSLSYTRPDSRIDKEIISRKLDCDPISLRCSAKGFKQGTKKFLQCKKDIKNELTLEEKKTNNSGKEKQRISQQTELTNKNKYTITDKQEPSCGFVQEFFGGVDCFQENMDKKFGVCMTYETWVEKAECTDKVINSEIKYRNDPFVQEISAFRKLLIERVKTGKITETEANYALQQKKAEINQRIAGIRAQNRQLDLIERQQDSIANQEKMERDQEQDQIFIKTLRDSMRSAKPVPTQPIKNPETTECQPDGYGGIRCTTHR